MKTYVIEKLVRGEWIQAWGLKARSYPNASNHAQAIEIFHEETKKCRTPHRLVCLSGWGYSVGKDVIADNNGRVN